MNDWNIYPRPSLKRNGNYKILNDGWTLNNLPVKLPFPPESKLCEYKGKIIQVYTYQKKIELPQEAVKCLKKNGKLMLYFGAVDQVCSVYANDELVGHSELGYFTLTCDITKQADEAIANNDPAILIRLEGEDFLDHSKPYGKQRTDRGGMWYTPISGVWQTVWMEWLPESYISKINYDVEESRVTFKLCFNEEENNSEKKVKATLKTAEGDYNFLIKGNNYSLDLSSIEIAGKKHQPQFWTAENPYLYELELDYNGDKVETYFALRSVSIEKVTGVQRICINHKPVFLNGVLDQGYFEDGIFTPESPEEYKKDILRMKELGFNTLRKHIKVEPEIFYYLCDSLGIYVIQDMVNNGPYNFLVDTALATVGLKKNDKNRYDENQKEWFKLSAFETQNFLHNHPSVIAYTVFNEGWGQTDSDEIGDLLKERDPSRIYDYTSGWFKQQHSDVDSVHIYFRTKKLKPELKPLLLSEFGGFSRAVEGHIWNPKRSYGYGKCKDEKELTDRIIETYKKMVLPAIPLGLCAAIYTQLSDVEDEINGFYTYDRTVCKVDKNRIAEFMLKELKIC